MATRSAPSQPVAQLENFLRTDVICVTLKFGFQQKPFKYPMNDTSCSTIEKIYRDAENWLRSILSNTKNLQLVERYTLYLFRIPSSDLTMVPIAQLSDLEQNSLIELVVVPVEINQNPHALYRCQLNVPTNCSKCSRLITGIYRQGFRCRKCRMTYHKDCAPFLLDDCSVLTDPPSPTRKSASTSLSFVNPFVQPPVTSANSTLTPDTKTVPIYSPSSNTSKETEQSAMATTIIDEGIFPACISGRDIYQRYLFRLTRTSLTLTTTLSNSSSPQPQQTRQASETDTLIPLAEINDIILTHFIDDRDHVFEIHFQGKFVLCVGKKSDSDDLQMQTAQFYSSIRDQWEALATTTQPAPPTATIPVPTAATANSKSNGNLKRRQSIYRRPPQGTDNEDKDLHELYTFTGEKIGEGMRNLWFDAKTCYFDEFRSIRTSRGCNS